MTTRSVPWAPGRLPGIGHAHRLLGDPLPLLRELPELGPVVRVGLGPRTLYMVTTPELLRSIGLGTAGRFHREDLIEPIAPFAGRTLVTLSGDAHRRRRRQIAPAFHRNRIATYAPAFARIARQWVSELPVGEPIDLAPEADRLSLATLTSTLIAADVGSEALAAVRVDSPLLLAEASFRTILPRAFWRLRPGADRRYHASAARLRGMLETVVVDYRRSGRDPGDLLSGLLMHTGPGSGDVLDDEAVIDELVGFLMGGIESPAGIFVALIHELVRAPGVRDRVIAEVDEVVGDGPVAAEHATALPYLRNTLLETMRLWSAWINMLTADGPVCLGDVEVPSGAMVGFSVNMIHHDPRNYTDPERFLPSRWEQPDVELIDPDAVAPFGVGVRKCPADHFSWSELTLQAAALLRDRLPVLPESDRGVPVGVTTKGVGVRPASARVVLYPRR